MVHDHSSVLLCLGGSVAGVAYKILGDFAYDNSRKAWIKVRVHTMNSPRRVLEVRKPQFPPDYRHGEANKGKSVTGTYSADGKRLGDLPRHDDSTVEEQKPSITPSFWWSIKDTDKKKLPMERQGDKKNGGNQV